MLLNKINRLKIINDGGNHHSMVLKDVVNHATKQVC